MVFSPRHAALIGASLLLLGASLGSADAMPVAPVQAGFQTAGQAAGQTGKVEQAAYLHRRYPGYHSRFARAYRHARRNSPNRFCRNQPSRCR